WNRMQATHYKSRPFASCPLARRRATRPVRVLAQSTESTAALLNSHRGSFASDPSYTFAPIINGCWQLAGGHGREVFDDIQSKLAAHVAAGYTTFDTADIYGPSEAVHQVRAQHLQPAPHPGGGAGGSGEVA
ncbi:hypothetical protein Agub_g4826, partial [Astrephomene gubernaculifera]